MTLNEKNIRELLAEATPGPWEWNGYDLDGQNLAIVLDIQVECGELCQGGMAKLDDTPNLEYDQQLIALAPELAADWLRMRRDLVDFRAALQDGATNPELTPIDHSWCEAARDGIDRILNGETND